MCIVVLNHHSVCGLENGLGMGWETSWGASQIGGWRLGPGTSSGGKMNGHDLPIGINGACFGGRVAGARRAAGYSECLT